MPHAEYRRIIGLHPLLRLDVELALLHRQGKDRRALEHRQMRRVLAGFLHHLNAARSGSHDANPFAREASAFLRPQRRVMALTGKAFKTLVVGDIGFGRKTGAKDEEPGAHGSAVGRADNPFIARLVEFRRADARAEPYVPAQVEFFVNVMEIAAQLVPGRKSFGPVPVAP